mmetsp:Transcript_25117/g.53195  ORF Transcript_25117/g.53195 Transcript_25117/m.53195 type:complete len:606 (+) Transcript_25117:88-1905(+)
MGPTLRAAIAVACLLQQHVSVAQGSHDCTSSNAEDCAMPGADEMAVLQKTKQLVGKVDTDTEGVVNDAKGGMLGAQSPTSQPMGARTHWMSFQGNGMYAESCYAGLFIGLLAQLSKKTGKPASVEALGSGMDGITTVSGATWFFAHLIYSPSFVKMLENLGDKLAEHGDAPDIAIQWHGMFTNVAMPFDYIKVTNATWQDYVAEEIMNNAAGIPANATVSAPVNAWAVGKMWMIATSLPTAQETFMLTSLKGHVHSIATTPHLIPLPPLTPAKFSILLTSEGGRDADQFFCATEACFDYSVKYNYGINLWPFASTVTSPPLGPMFRKSFNNLARLPLSGLVAASSVASTLVAFGQLTASIKPILQYSTVWTADGDDPFATGTEEIKKLHSKKTQCGIKKAVKESAAKGLTALGDGVYTGAAGICHALASGATNVTGFFNIGDKPDGEQGFGPLKTYIFADANNTFASAMGSFFPKMAKDLMPGIDAFTGFPSLKTPPGTLADQLKSLDVDVPANINSTALKAQVVGIYYGTFDTYTLQQDYCGVEYGRPVTLNVIIVSSNGIQYLAGGPKPLASMVKTIAETIADPKNEQHVDTILSYLMIPGLA